MRSILQKHNLKPFLQLCIQQPHLLLLYNHLILQEFLLQQQLQLHPQYQYQLLEKLHALYLPNNSIWRFFIVKFTYFSFAIR